MLDLCLFTSINKTHTATTVIFTLLIRTLVWLHSLFTGSNGSLESSSTSFPGKTFFRRIIWCELESSKEDSFKVTELSVSSLLNWPSIIGSSRYLTFVCDLCKLYSHFRICLLCTYRSFVPSWIHYQLLLWIVSFSFNKFLTIN